MKILNKNLPPIDMVIELAARGLQELLCKSLANQNEWAFSINLRNDPKYGAYMVAQHPKTDNKKTSCRFKTELGRTKYACHTHMFEGKLGGDIYISNEPSYKDFESLRGNSVNLEMGFIIDLHGNFIWFKNNITTFNWDYIEGYQFDFSKCICKDKI